MSTAETALRIALVGNPNCGKTALFNLLTGSRQKVANYAGVTVERKQGRYVAPSGRVVDLLDLPGAYSLDAASPDEAITRDVCLGIAAGETRPDLLVCVADATNLRLHLRFVLEVRRLGVPVVLALNMMDAAARRGIRIDIAALERELGIPVIETVAVKRAGARALVERIDGPLPPMPPAGDADLDLHAEVRRLLAATVSMPTRTAKTDDAIDRVALHPVWGLVLLGVLMFLIFQSVFSWAEPLMDGIENGIKALGAWSVASLPEGPLRSLLADGVFAGLGSVLVFLPQILILFLFILALEESGYLPRAAFLLDRLMFKAGLSGRSFIPLLSSFACAIPGIMATRSIQDPRDRLATIMVAPLMTCSARLPVYTLLIAAFIPQRTVAGLFNLQGIVLFALYVAGIVSALAVAFVIKRLRRDRSEHALLLELPSYRWPHPRDLAIGLWNARGLPQARRRHHPRADCVAVVPVELPGAAGRRDRTGHRLQLRRPHRPCARIRVRAGRLQLADLHRPDPGPGRARSRGVGAGHGVCAVGQRRHHRRRARPADRRPVAAGHGAVAAGLVHLRAADAFPPWR